jgi:hypothetical protein
MILLVRYGFQVQHGLRLGVSDDLTAKNMVQARQLTGRKTSLLQHHKIYPGEPAFGAPSLEQRERIKTSSACSAHLREDEVSAAARPRTV